MTPRITLTLAICAIAAAITAVALFSDPTSTPAAPATVESAVVETVSTVAAPLAAGEVPPAPAPAPAPAAGALTIEDFAFVGTPVAPGATVSVTNLDGAPHTVSGDAFDVGVDASGTESFIAPTEPGTYPFICEVHPSMKGELVVG